MAQQCSLNDVGREALKAAKDAAYIAIGFSVLAAQQAQTRARELRERFRSQSGESRHAAEQALEHLGDAWKHGVKALDDRLAVVTERVEGLLEQVESTLPEQVREPFAKARELAGRAQDDLRNRLGVADSPAA